MTRATDDIDEFPGAARRAAPRRASDAADDYERRRDFRAIHSVCNIYGKAFQRVRVHTPCPLPRTGPALVASNHTAGLDPITIQSVCPRPIVWIMTHEYYDKPSLRWFLKYAEMIRIDREGRDSGAWRDALRMLKKGRVVGVFPEGRIERTPALMPFQSGVALLAMRGGADFFPVYVDGLQRNKPMLDAFLTPQHPSVAWGKPLTVAPGKPDKDKLASITAELQRRVEALRVHYPSPRRRGTPMLGGA